MNIIMWFVIGLFSAIYCMKIMSKEKKHLQWPDVFIFIMLVVFGFMSVFISAILTLLCIIEYCNNNKINIKNPFYKGKK
jgi:predicted cation transporter